MVHLDLVILSIVTNTATCEHLFYELVQIHTASRNRLKLDKVKKLSIVRQAVRKKNAIELWSQEMSASTPRRIIEAKERKMWVLLMTTTRRTRWTSGWRRSAFSKRRMIRNRTVRRRRKKNLWKS